MSAPSPCWISIERSGVKRWKVPSTCEVNETPSSSTMASLPWLVANSSSYIVGGFCKFLSEELGSCSSLRREEFTESSSLFCSGPPILETFLPNPSPSENTWNPPESVIIGPSKPINLWMPPAFSINSGPGERYKWYVLAMMVCIPSASNSDALIPLTSALVPTATNAGVCISPCGVLKTPARARPGPCFCMLNLLSDTNQLYLKNQRRVCRYRPVGLRAVRHARRDNKQSLAADLHPQDALLPSRYHIPLPELELYRRFADGGVKHGPVVELAGVLHAYHGTSGCFGAGADHLVLHDKPGACRRRRGVHKISI